MANIEIGGRLHSTATGNVVTGANEVLDDVQNKKQQEINAELIEAVGTGGSVDSRIAAAVNVEKTRAEGAESTLTTNLGNEVIRATNAENALDGRVDTLEEAVGTGGSIDSRISSAVNSAKSEIKGNATSACDTLGEAEALISAEATRAQAAESNLNSGKADKATTLAGYGITDAYTKSETYTKTEVNGLVDTPHQEYVTVDAYASLPATGSKDTIYRVSNYNGSTSQVDASVYSEYAWNGSQYIFLCVKSQIGEVFDISVYNNNAKYADLAAALNGGANIPQSLQKGGMSIKFVQSSDNKYIQARCMAQNFTTDVTQWQGVDDELVYGSKNLIESGSVSKAIYGEAVELWTTQTLRVGYYYNTHGTSIGNLSSNDSIACQVFTGLSQGDKFKLTGFAGNSTWYQFFVTTDANGLILRRSELNVNYRTEPLIVTIQEGESKLYVNLADYDSTTDRVEKLSSVEYFNGLIQGTVFDISEYNAVNGIPSVYTDLADALGIDGANIPIFARKGGIIVKFIRSDNKYVQCRLVNKNWSIDISDWQAVDDAPGVTDNNLVKSVGVYTSDIKTSVRVDDAEAKVYSLVGHDTDKTFVSSLILTEPHSYGYYYLNSPIPSNKMITAIKRNGKPYTGEVYVKFSDDSSELIDQESLPISYSKVLDRIFTNITVPQYIEVLYTEPSADGVIKNLQDSLVNKESYKSEELYLLNKNYYSFKSFSIIDSNGDFHENGGFIAYGFYCENLLEIICKVASNGASYAVAFYSSESVFDSTTLISDNSVKHISGIQSLTLTKIPSNAKVVFVTDRNNSLPWDQIELSLKYAYKPKVEDSIKSSIKVLNSVCQIEQDLYLKVTNNISVYRSENTQSPLFCKQGDIVKLKIAEDASALLADNNMHCYLRYSDGSYSSSFIVGYTGFSSCVCEKDVIAIVYYLPKENVIGTGVVHFKTKIEETNTRTRTDVKNVTAGHSLYYLDCPVDAKAGECIDITVETTEGALNTVALYSYERTSNQREFLSSINPNESYRLYCPYPVNKIGFYSADAALDCTVNITISIHKGDMLTVPSWYTDSYLFNKESRIKELISAANGKVISFAFITDEHIDYLAYNCKAPSLIKHLCDNVNIDAVINGGDISNGINISLRSFVDSLEKASENSLLLNAVGNHDYMGNFTDGKLYGYLYKKNYSRYGNPARGYYYVDNEFQKVRFVILNAFADNGAVAKDGYETTQVQWFTNEALNTPSDWKVIVFSHCFYIAPIYNDSPYYPYRIQSGAGNIMAAIKANNEEPTKGKVLMCAQGHTHNDRIISTTVTESVPVIITTSDAVKPNLDGQGRPDHNVTRTIGTISEQAFDVFVVNLETMTANIVRIGAKARDGVDSAQGDEVEERVIQL